MPILDMDPGQSPEAPGTLSFYEQGRDPSTGFQVTSGGVVATPGGVSGPVLFTGDAAATDGMTIRVAGDTQPRLVIDADGTIRWGPGNGALDFAIGRYAVGGIEVSGALRFTNGQLLFGPAGDVNLYRGGGTDELKTDDNVLVVGTVKTNSSLIAATAGGGLQVKEGSNATMGVTAAMTAGTITVNTTKVTANSRVFLTAQNTGGTAGALRVSARTPGTSFTITSTSGTDTSTVAWFLVEPAA